jgi:phage terminase small subunit
MPILENPRHELFAQAVAKGSSASEAYASAGYGADDGNAARLKSDEAVTARIEELLQDAARVAGIDTVRTIKELGRIGFSDLRNAFDKDGRLKTPEDWSDDFAASVASVKVVTRNAGKTAEGLPEVEYVTEIKQWDKNSALEKIAKHLGMLVDRREITGREGRDLIPENSPSNVDLAKVILSILSNPESETSHET